MRLAIGWCRREGVLAHVNNRYRWNYAVGQLQVDDLKPGMFLQVYQGEHGGFPATPLVRLLFCLPRNGERP